MVDATLLTDEELVDAIRAGDATAFNTVFHRFFGSVLAQAMAAVDDQTDAARVTADTFHAIWLHLDQLVDGAGLGDWLIDTADTFGRQRRAAAGGTDRSTGVAALSEAELRTGVAKVLARRQLPVRPGGRHSGSEPYLGDEIELLTIDEVPPSGRRLHRHGDIAMLSWLPESLHLSVGTLTTLGVVVVAAALWLGNGAGHEPAVEVADGYWAIDTPSAPVTLAEPTGDASRPAEQFRGVATGMAASGASVGDSTPPASSSGRQGSKSASPVVVSQAPAPTTRPTQITTRPPVTPVSPSPTSLSPAPTTFPVATTASTTPRSATTTTAEPTATSRPTTSSTARPTTTSERSTTTSRPVTTIPVTTTTVKVTTTTDEVTTTTVKVTTTTVKVTTTTTAASASTASSVHLTTTSAAPTTTTQPPTTLDPPHGSKAS